MTTADEQFSAILGLSRCENGVELSKAILETLVSQDIAQDAALFEVHRPVGPRDHDHGSVDDLMIRRFAAPCVEAERREPVPGIREAIRMMLPVTLNDHGTQRLIVPIASTLGPIRVIALDNVGEGPQLRMRALQFIEIYANLIRLMDSRERDELTGLLNRQLFSTLVEMLNHRSREKPSDRLIMAVLDIDHFKQVNDRHGHLVGDEVLIHFAQLMKREFRYQDGLFRFGGEEFIATLATDPKGNGGAALERFRQEVERYHFPGVGRVTVSIGYTVCEDDVLPTTVIDRADKALYFAKQTGRNRVICFEDLASEPFDLTSIIDLF